MTTTKNAKNRIKSISRVMLPILVCLPASLLVYQLVLLPIASAAPATDPAIPQDVLSKLGPRTAVTLVLAMIVLVGSVFALFISFGRRLQNRSFMGPLVADAIAKGEIARQEARAIEDLRLGKIEPELTPGSEEFNRRYGIPPNEPIPPMDPGVNIDEARSLSREFGYADGWHTPMPGMPGTQNPFPDNGGPYDEGESHKPGGNSLPGQTNWYAFAANVREAVPNWTVERLVTERNATRLESHESDSKKTEKLIISKAIQHEIKRRFLVGYRQEQLNAFHKKRNEITTKVRERTESLLPTVDVSSFGGGWTFVLEFTTIIFIVFSVLALGLLGVLTSEPIAAILAAIAGYVLGKSTNIRGTGGEEIRRGGEEPKALFEALTKQTENQALRNEEKSKLEREVEALQQKLACR